MKVVNRFLNLFHQKQRFSPGYETLSWLKKVMFFGVTGFVVGLSVSKFIQGSLIYSFEPTEENKMMIKLNPPLERGVYHPNILMVAGILQRLYSKYREEEPYMRTSEEEVEGEKVHLVVLHDKATHRPKKDKKGIPLVFVVAGSEGVDNTVRHLMLTAYNLGYRTLGIDPSDLHDRKKLANIVRSYSQKYPKVKIFGIGVEYGANLLVNTAADNPGLFDGLVSVGNPFDLAKAQINLQSSWMWRLLYRDILRGRLRRAEGQPSTNKVESLFQVDKLIYGLSDEKLLEWKKQQSCINSIPRLKTRTLFLQSHEDPFSLKIEGDQRFENENCLYVSTKRGGHNEWFQNLWMNRWFISPIRYFIKLLNQDAVHKIVHKQKMRQQAEKQKGSLSKEQK